MCYYAVVLFCYFWKMIWGEALSLSEEVVIFVIMDVVWFLGLRMYVMYVI